LRTAVDAILTVDEHGVIETANPAVERLFGYAQAELVGRNVSMLMPSPDRETHNDYIQRYVETGEARVIGIGREVTGRRKDGSLFPLHLSVSEMRIGERQMFTGILSDLSEVKTAEEAARKQRGAPAVHPRHDSGWHVGLAYRKRNSPLVRHLEDIHGLTPGAFAGTFEAFQEDIYPEDREHVTEAIENALGGVVPDYSVEYRIVRPDGAIRWLAARGRVLHDVTGQTTGLTGLCMDVTERRLAESVLQASELKFRTLTSLAPVGIFVSDMQGHCVMVNERWQHLAGISQQQALGTGWVAALHPDDRERVIEEWHGAVRQGSEFLSEYRFHKADGSVTWVRGAAKPLVGTDGRVEGYIRTSTDITDLKQTGELKDQFLSLVSHELMTPIATVLGNGLLLLKRGDSLTDDDKRRALADVVSESQRLQRIVENLLFLTRMEAHQEIEFEPLILGLVATEAAEAFAHRNPDRRISLEIEDGVPFALGQTTLVALVLENLISNADKYSQPDAPIEVFVRQNERGEPEICVRDYGIGIEEAELENLFMPFYRSQKAKNRAKGMGLGLAVSKRVVAAQGGSIC
jgi:PAS domain S-box-containing protein